MITTRWCLLLSGHKPDVPSLCKLCDAKSPAFKVDNIIDNMINFCVLKVSLQRTAATWNLISRH